MKRIHQIATSIVFINLVVIVQAKAQDLQRGEKIFEACASCHALIKEEQSTVGPSLFGIFGRKAGTQDDYRYSPAMKRSGITWNKQTLNNFLTDPQKLIPANRMPFDGIPNLKDRNDLTAFMQVKFK
jgi:cytochrome c